MQERLERVLDELVQLKSGFDHRSSLRGDAIVVDALAKTYPNGTEAVHGVTFRVAVGESYGLLGPNGAGKSTTIGMLGTLVRPTSGRASVAGFDVVAQPREVRRRIGFAMQEVGVDAFATARELLVLQGRLQGLGRGESGHRRASCSPWSTWPTLPTSESASSRAACSDASTWPPRSCICPRCVFLDEPSEGLDPHARSAIWDALDRLRAHLGLTVVLTTHHMDEADRLCDRLGIIDQGRLVAEDTPTALKASVGSDSLEDVYLHYTEHAFDRPDSAVIAMRRAA